MADVRAELGKCNSLSEIVKIVNEYGLRMAFETVEDTSNCQTLFRGRDYEHMVYKGRAIIVPTNRNLGISLNFS